MRRYDAAAFKGSAASYAGQGICSMCADRRAEWMVKRGAVLIALCDECAQQANRRKNR